MSSSLAAFRNTSREDLQKLATDHLNHDLTQSDRDTLRSASSKLGTHATIGSMLGLGFGIFMAYRLRTARTSMFNAFRAREKPVAVQFADGRTEPIPDLTDLLRPTTLGDIAAYSFFAAGGLFVGGETGLLSGSWSAGRTVKADPESRKRIEDAFRRFRADVLRKEADALDGGQSVLDKMF